MLDSDHVDKIKNNLNNIQSGACELPDGKPSRAFKKDIHADIFNGDNCKITASVSGFDVKMDEPIDNGGDDSAPTPVDMLVSAISGCLHLTFSIFCALSGVSLEELHTEAEATIDRRCLLGNLDKYPPRLDSIHIKVMCSSDESEDKLLAILEKAHRSCPVGGSLHPDIKSTFELKCYSTDAC